MRVSEEIQNGAVGLLVALAAIRKMLQLFFQVLQSIDFLSGFLQLLCCKRLNFRTAPRVVVKQVQESATIIYRKTELSGTLNNSEKLKVGLPILAKPIFSAKWIHKTNIFIIADGFFRQANVFRGLTDFDKGTHRNTSLKVLSTLNPFAYNTFASSELEGFFCPFDFAQGCHTVFTLFSLVRKVRLLRNLVYMLRLMLVASLIALPASAQVLPNKSGETSYDACVSQWDGTWSFEALDAAGIADEVETSEDVFCGHFMSAEDLPTDVSSHDIAPTPLLVLAQPSRLAVPAPKAYKVQILSEHIPHSLPPEVAPHPPKTC